jgi:hypothetical protein
MINKISKRNIIIPILAVSILVYLYTFTSSNHYLIDNSIADPITYAQMNSPNGSSTTILGDVMIPSNTNDTKTTVVNNISNNNTIPTAINQTLVAQNVTSAVNIVKENTTTPISPTGISTQGLHQPPQHRLTNNTINSTSNTTSNTSNLQT